MLLMTMSSIPIKTTTARFILAAVVLFSVNLLVAPTSAWSQTPAPVAVSAQQDDGWVTIKTDEGVLFVWNVKGLYFSLAIKGTEIKPYDDPDHIFLGVDGRILQIQVAAITAFAPDVKEKKLDDKAILAAHRDWEAKFNKLF